VPTVPAVSQKLVKIRSLVDRRGFDARVDLGWADLDPDHRWVSHRWLIGWPGTRGTYHAWTLPPNRAWTELHLSSAQAANPRHEVGDAAVVKAQHVLGDADEADGRDQDAG